MYIAVGQTSHQPDGIPKPQANNLRHQRFFPFAPDNKERRQNAVSFYTTKSLRKPDMPTHW